MKEREEGEVRSVRSLRITVSRKFILKNFDNNNVP